MKKYLLFAVMIVALSFSSCEKDDICVDGDTPLLIVVFYDAESPKQPKLVNNLRVVGVGQTTTVNTISDRTALDSIAIPLNAVSDLTSFIMIVDSDDDDNGAEIGNLDTVNFAHDTVDTFVSRACGFVANYENLGATSTSDNDNWIQEIEILKSTVELEETTTAHVKIYH